MNKENKNNREDNFSGIRGFLWPIHRHELKKVLPMIVMMFCFLFNYTIMRDTKDTLILTSAGAEAIPFLKFWGTLPMSILFILVYATLSNRLKPERLFYLMILPFLLFFTLFGFFLYPFRELLQPAALVAYLTESIHQSLPARMHVTAFALLEVVNNWIYALFYILSELWGSMGISLLFWQFANQITKTSEAKRFYTRFTQMGNLSLVISGMTIIYFSDIRDSLPPDVDAWGVTLKWLMGAIGLSCITIMAAYYWMQRNVIEAEESENKKKPEKTKLGIKESCLMLLNSPYLGMIALLVLCYGVAINLVEVVYKSQLKLQFPDANAMSTFLGYISIFIGITTFILVTFSGQILRKLGWLPAALATPLFVLLTGAIFFSLVIFNEEIANYLPYTPLWIAVVMGATQNVLSKGAKYALFDPTKEMAYIPLDGESKLKGKAAIDVVGGRLGKSGGGLILQFVLMFGAIMDNIFVLFAVVTLVILAWIYAVLGLNRRYKKMV